MKKPRVSKHFVIAALLSIMTVPMATMHSLSAAASSLPRGIISDEMRERVQEYERDVRERREAYFKAVEDCQARYRKTKMKEQCPVFNDVSTYIDYLPKNSKYRFNLVDDAGTGTGEAVYDMAEKQALKEKKERAQLRRYVQMGTCPESLKQYTLSGFYELCKKLVRADNAKAPRTYLNEKIKLNPEATYKPITLKERLEMVRQARDPRTRRENTKVGTSGSGTTKSAAPTEQE